MLQYEEYNATTAAPWIAAGKQQFWYHCIEPSSEAYLNTFIERHLIQDRGMLVMLIFRIILLCTVVYFIIIVSRKYSFIEELFWLGALSNLMNGAPSGWFAICAYPVLGIHNWLFLYIQILILHSRLYYAVDLWNPEPGFPRKVMQTISGTPFTNFNPGNYIWAPVYDDIFANGINMRWFLVLRSLIN